MDIIEEEENNEEGSSDLTAQNIIQNYLNKRQSTKSMKRQSADFLAMVKPGQILEMQTRIELLQAENAQLN